MDFLVAVSRALRCSARLQDLSRDKIRFFKVCLAIQLTEESVGTFSLDRNEGGCNDVFFFDQTTGLVSGTIFDGRGALARTTDGGLNWSTTLYDQSIEGVAFLHPPAPKDSGLARAAESSTQRILESPGATKQAEAPQTSMMSRSPATH
jgi:hypothetical protein